MKKKYISPAILVMKIEAETIMAASDGLNTIDVAFDNSGNTFNGSFRAKGHSSVWDFDDEEED